MTQQPLWHELRLMLRHAGTVLAGQLAVMAFGVTDTIVAGQHSAEALAALSIGSAIYISVFVTLMGMVQALLPVWAELHGARQPRRLGHSVHQSLYLSAAIALLGMGLLCMPGPVLELTQVPVALQADVRDYLQVLALALPPALLFRLYSTLNQSLGKPLLVTWLQLGSLLLKIPLTWLLALGLGLEGQPGLGVVGCAWATLLVNLVMVSLAVLLLRRASLYRRYQLWQKLPAPDFQQLRQFLRLGLPAGLAVGVEVTSFTLMALFIARLGPVATASHQIASNLAAVSYMVPLSISIACSARVGYWLGAASAEAARRCALLGWGLVAVCASLASALLWNWPQALAQVYTQNPPVALAAQQLLPWVAVYHGFDAIQALCVFVLRCYRITLVPLLVYSLLLWGLGLGGGYQLAYGELLGWRMPDSTAAFWLTSSAALALTAVVFSLLLWHASARAAAQS